jgi:tetratricopeptide (TPR) repeat protein
MVMRIPAIALAILMSSCFAQSHAADVVNYGPAPDWVEPVPVPKDDGNMADAPAKALLRSYQLRFTETSSENYSEDYIRLQTPQGVQALGNIVLPWRPDTDVFTVHKFHLLRGDEVIDILANGQTFEVLRRENNLEHAALDGILTATIQPHGMEVGDVLNVAFSIKRESKLIPNPETLIAGVAEMPPAATVELRVVWDKRVPLKWRATSQVTGIRESRKDSNVELRWKARELVPAEQPNDVPARFWVEPVIEFSSFASWNEVSRKLASLYAKAVELEPDSPLKAEAAAIAAASTDPVARIEAALKLAQDRVRYVFLGMGEGGLNPATADLTWQRRFGDCKGKSALLIALLGELGVEAEPVAVNTAMGDALVNRLPALGAFNHVIVRARAGGQTYWLDGAGSGSWRRADMALPNYQWGLPVTARGEALLRMAAGPSTEPLLEIETSIDARQGLHVDAPFMASARLRGATGAMLHAQLSGMTPGAREQALRNYWKDRYDFVEIGTVASAFDVRSGIVTLTMEGTAHMAWGGYSYTTDGLRVGLRSDFKREFTINADAPFVIAHPLYTLTRQRIQLPPVGDFTLSGKQYDATLAGTHYVRKASIEGRVFTGEVSLRSVASEVTAAEARAARKPLNDMWADWLEIVAKNYYVTSADITALKKREFNDSKNLMWRGNVMLDNGEYQAALADFEAVIKLDPDDANALAHRGLANHWLQKYRAAKVDLEAALVKEPGNAVALRGLGAVLRMSRQYPEAVRRLTESLKIEPKDTFALSNRAYAYAMMEDPDNALLDAAEVIRLRPKAVDMYDLRAWILTAQGKEAEALAELDAMFAANPEDTGAQWAASHNYSRLHRYADAVLAMDRVIASKPEAYNYLKRAEVRDPADLAGQLADVDAALTKKPDSEQALGERARLLSELGRHQAAIAVYGAQIEKMSAFTEKRRLLTLRGIQYAKLGKTAESRKDLTAALSDGPDGDAYNNHCWYLAAARVELESALASCNKALELAPKDSAYLDSRGFVLLQLARFDEAIASYDAALALKPKLAAALYGRGMAKKRRCSCDAGDEDLRAGELVDPHVESRFARAGLAP